MGVPQLMTMKEVASLVGRPAHRVIHLCETGLVRPAENPTGRGKMRRFNRENVFCIAVGLDLQDAGLQIPVIEPVMKSLDFLKKKFRTTQPKFQSDLVDLIGSLGTDKNPILMYLYPPNTAVITSNSLANTGEDAKFLAALAKHQIKPPSEPATVLERRVAIVTNLSMIVSELGL